MFVLLYQHLPSAPSLAKRCNDKRVYSSPQEADSRSHGFYNYSFRVRSRAQIRWHMVNVMRIPETLIQHILFNLKYI